MSPSGTGFLGDSIDLPRLGSWSEEKTQTEALRHTVSLLTCAADFLVQTVSQRNQIIDEGEVFMEECKLLKAREDTPAENYILHP